MGRIFHVSRSVQKLNPIVLLARDRKKKVKQSRDISLLQVTAVDSARFYLVVLPQNYSGLNQKAAKLNLWVLLFMLLFAGDHLGCPNGWSGWKDWCYYLPRKSSKVDYEEADDRCQHYGGELASIHSEAEQDFITNIIYYGCENIYRLLFTLTKCFVSLLYTNPEDVKIFLFFCGRWID